MPISKQATKKMRHDKIVTAKNRKKKETLRKEIKAMREKPSTKTLASVFSLLDKAVKGHTIHKNKAARVKSRLAKVLSK